VGFQAEAVDEAEVVSMHRVGLVGAAESCDAGWRAFVSGCQNIVVDSRRSVFDVFGKKQIFVALLESKSPWHTSGYQGRVPERSNQRS
jgi:hypothetical protein